MRVVQVFLDLLGTSGLRFQRVQLAAGHGELGLRAFQLRAEPDRFLLDLASPAIDLGVDLVARVPLRLRLLRDVASELVAFDAHGLQLTLDQTGLALGLQQPCLHLRVGAARGRTLLEHPLGDVELFQRLAVLILDDVEPLLGGGRALFGLLARVGLLAEAGRRQFERTLRGTGRRRRDPLSREVREARVRRGRRGESHDPVEHEQRDDQADRHEDRVVPPRAPGGCDHVVGSCELDRSVDGAVAAEAEGDEDREHAAALFGGDRPTLCRIADLGPSLFGPLSDQRAIGRVDDLTVERPDRDVVPRAGIQEDRRDLGGDQVGLRVGGGSADVSGGQCQGQGVLDDRSGLIHRGGFRLADGAGAEEHGAHGADGQERRQGEQQRTGDSKDVPLAGHRSPYADGPLGFYRRPFGQAVVGHGRDMVGIG